MKTMLKRAIAFLCVFTMIVCAMPEQAGTESIYSDWYGGSDSSGNDPTKNGGLSYTFGETQTALLSEIQLSVGIWVDPLLISRVTVSDPEKVEIQEKPGLLTYDWQITSKKHFDEVTLKMHCFWRTISITLRNPVQSITPGEPVVSEAGVFAAQEAVPEGTALTIGEYEPTEEIAVEAQALAGERAIIAWMDISLTAEGEKVETAAAVSLNTDITLPETPGMGGLTGRPVISDLKMIHVKEDGTLEALEANGTIEENVLKEVSFYTESFSGFGIAYTVDFAYEGGETSIRGGDAVSLRTLLPMLGITEDVLSVEEIEEATFSTPELAALVRIEEDTTAEAIKADYTIEYSAELSEEDIAEMNGKEFLAPDWILISLKSFETEESLTLKTADGRVITVQVTDALYSIGETGVVTDLDGKTFAIVNATSLNAIQGEAQNNNTRLKAINTKVEGDYAWAKENVTLWTFTAAEQNGYYYIQTNDGKYLNIEGRIQQPGNNVLDGRVTVSDTRKAIRVTAGTGDRNGQIKITNENGVAVSNINGSSGDGFGATNGNGNNEWFRLMELANLPEYMATKVSVTDLRDNQEVLIYRPVYNSVKNSYEDFVIDGNGNLVKSYDKGDRVTLYSAVSPVWKLIIHTEAGVPNGYYDFYNEETGVYLSPQSDGTLVSSTRPGVLLNGRQNGEYNSTIEKWDTATWAYYGYQISRVEDQTPTLSSATGEASQAFSFASYSEPAGPVAQLHPVDTVDSSNVTIHMFNYPDRNTIASVTGQDSWAEDVLPASHVNRRLVNGYPVFTKGGKGATLFSPTNDHHKGTANHLFLDSVYQSTGYYEYSSFNNFAHYDAGSGNFTVYQEIGTPKNDSNFFYKRGNFLPFNDLNINDPASNTNDYSGSGAPLDIEDPMNGKTLYNITGGADYYFGMTMEANFMQPKNGIYHGNPVVYEFNGDDDLWVFIDGVLILDIGGVHDAWPGSINFQTGKVRTKKSNSQEYEITTIRECFKKAGVFPDGTAWDESRVDEYFRGDTFVDYGKHEMKMFYMEHGAGASNLEIRFNLPVIEKGQFTVEKLVEGIDPKFANVRFAFQAFRKGTNGEDIPLTSAKYEGTQTDVPFFNNVEINGKTFDNVFYLKPGEAAKFPAMRDDVEYYVQELGIGSDYYDQVTINDVIIRGEDVTQIDGVYRSTVAKVGNRVRVSYANRVAETNKNDLRITKELAEGSRDDGSKFEFRVLIENAKGKLVPYSVGPYMIQDAEGVYWKYLDGKLVPNGFTPINASVSGQNGTIAGIPAGKTVIIKDLVSGTDFFVEEIRNPVGWSFVEKIVDEDSCETSTLTGIGHAGQTVTADGMTKLGADAQVTIVNKADQTPVDIGGTKILIGRDMYAEEFTFILKELAVDENGNATPGDVVAEAVSTAGAAGEETSFLFPQLNFQRADFVNAENRDAEGKALYYYLAEEVIPEGAEGRLYNSVVYSEDRFLVVVKLSYSEGVLSTEKTICPFDGTSIPEELRPAPPATATV